MKKDVDVYNYLKKTISKRVKFEIDSSEERGKTDDWLIENKDIERISKGKTRSANYGQRRNFLTVGNIDELQVKFEMSPKEILFGDDVELDELLFFIFHELALGLPVSKFTSGDFEKKSKNRNVEKVSKLIEEICLFDTNYVSYLYNLKTRIFFDIPIKNEKKKKSENQPVPKYIQVSEEEFLKQITDYENSKRLLDNRSIRNDQGELIQRADYAQYNYYKNENNAKYENAVSYVWNFFIMEYGEQARNSFSNLFFDGDYLKDKFKFSKINDVVSKWIKIELNDMLVDLYEIFKNDSIYSIGYKSYELTKDFDNLFCKKHLQLDQNQIDFMLNKFEDEIMKNEELSDEEKKLIISCYQNDENRKALYLKEIDNTATKRLAVEKELCDPLTDMYIKMAEELETKQCSATNKFPYIVYKDDVNRMIAKLLLKNFNVNIPHEEMFKIVIKNKQIVPTLYFNLEEDKDIENSYRLIDEAIESYEGHTQWFFGRTDQSQIDYEIIPLIVREIREENFNKENKREFEVSLERAIEEIPQLYIHMERYFKEHI